MNRFEGVADTLYIPLTARIYQHLGMTLDRIRNCGEKFHMYDLIRE